MAHKGHVRKLCGGSLELGRCQIRHCCQEKDAAELFINFMCDPEISGANMDYIWYGSPVSSAKEYMDPVLAESEVVYPAQEVLDKGNSFAFLPEDISRYMETLFMQVRNS